MNSLAFCFIAAQRSGCSHGALPPCSIRRQSAGNYSSGRAVIVSGSA